MCGKVINEYLAIQVEINEISLMSQLNRRRKQENLKTVHRDKTLPFQRQGLHPPTHK